MVAGLFLLSLRSCLVGAARVEGCVRMSDDPLRSCLISPGSRGGLFFSVRVYLISRILCVLLSLCVFPLL